MEKNATIRPYEYEKYNELHQRFLQGKISQEAWHSICAMILENIMKENNFVKNA